MFLTVSASVNFLIVGVLFYLAKYSLFSSKFCVSVWILKLVERSSPFSFETDGNL